MIFLRLAGAMCAVYCCCCMTCFVCCVSLDASARDGKSGDGSPSDFDVKVYMQRRGGMMGPGVFAKLQYLMMKKNHDDVCFVCYNNFAQGSAEYQNSNDSHEMAQVNCPNMCKFHLLCIQDWRSPLNFNKNYIQNMEACPKCGLKIVC